MKYIITEEQFSTIQTNNPNSILRMIEKIYNSMNMEGICEVDLGYDEEDNNFHCYLIIDKDWFDRLPRAVEDEEDMLDLASGARRTSRLSCQIMLTPELDGLVVHVPAESRNMQGL
jgi:hypothetical protein